MDHGLKRRLAKSGESCPRSPSVHHSGLFICNVRSSVTHALENWRHPLNVVRSSRRRTISTYRCDSESYFASVKTHFVRYLFLDGQGEFGDAFRNQLVDGSFLCGLRVSFGDCRHQFRPSPQRCGARRLSSGNGSVGRRNQPGEATERSRRNVQPPQDQNRSGTKFERGVRQLRILSAVASNKYGFFAEPRLRGSQVQRLTELRGEFIGIPRIGMGGAGKVCGSAIRLTIRVARR